LLGGPNAPITLRAQQPKPVLRAPAAKPKVTVAKPAPKLIPAKKPVPAPPKTSQPLRVAATKPVPKPTAPFDKPRELASRERSPSAKPAAMPPEKPALGPREQPIAPPASAAPHEELPPVLAERATPPPEAPPLDENLRPPDEETAPIPDRDFAQVDRLIERAARSGEIRPRTADAFTDELAEIADRQHQMLRQGAFSATERESLDQRLSALRDSIYAASEEQTDWRGPR
jgi:hypothetical protein